MKKQHRMVAPDRRAVGGGFYDKIIPTQTTRTTCSRCGIPTTLIGVDGECLKCRLQARKAAPDNAA